MDIISPIVRLLVGFLFLSLQTPQTDPNGLVHGIVRRSDTGAPVEGISIRIGSSVTTFTGADGRFSASVPPGNHAILVGTLRNSGLFLDPPGTRQLTVSAGKTHELSFAVAPGGVISGRVTNLKGEAIVVPTLASLGGSAGVTVVASRLSYVQGYAVLERKSSDTADDRGNYRIQALEPGTYIVHTDIDMNFNPTMSQTYYPGEIDFTRARTVTVSASDETAHIDFVVQGNPGYSVGIRILNASLLLGPPRRGFALYLATSNPDVPVNVRDILSPTTRSPATGDYSLAGVPPGDYHLFLVSSDFQLTARLPAPELVGTASFSLSPSRPQTDVSITLKEAKPVQGTVLSQVSGLPFEKVQLSLRPLSPPAGDPLPRQVTLYHQSIPIDASGIFSIPPVPQGRYALLAEGLPDGLGISDIRQGEASVLDGGFVVGEAPASIRVIVNRNPGGVRGTVRQFTMYGIPHATVTVIPNAARRGNPTFYRKVISDGAGVFRISYLPDGDYTLFAWDDMPDDAYQNASFMSQHEPQGVPISIKQGALYSNVELGLIRIRPSAENR